MIKLIKEVYITMIYTKVKLYKSCLYADWELDEVGSGKSKVHLGTDFDFSEDYFIVRYLNEEYISVSEEPKGYAEDRMI